MSRTAWLIGAAVFVGVLLTASIVLALTQREDEFAEGTPERAVQRFLIAARDQDFSTAHALLSEARRQECPIEDLIGTPYGGKQDLENSRVTLEDTKDLDDGGAVVIARVTRISSSGPFGTSESSSERRFTLSQEDGEWRLTGDPWPFYGCPRPRLQEPVEAPARPRAVEGEDTPIRTPALPPPSLSEPR